MVILSMTFQPFSVSKFRTNYRITKTPPFFSGVENIGFKNLFRFTVTFRSIFFIFFGSIFEFFHTFS